MGKRSKAKPAAAETDLDQPSAHPTAEALETEPATKRSRTTKQQQQQQSDGNMTQKAVKPPAAKAAASRKPRKQQQKQKHPEEDQGATEVVKPKRSRASPKAAAAAKEDKPAAEKPPYYLVKSEPDEFSIDDFEAKTNQTEPWEGVRNAQARNIMRGMAVGDLAFFYHSSCKIPGIVGIAQVVRQAYPDPTAFDPNSKYYDAKSSEDKPKWWMVDWKLVRKLKRQITLEELKGHKGGALEGMALFNRPRLSVQPVTKHQWEFILSLEDSEV